MRTPFTFARQLVLCLLLLGCGLVFTGCVERRAAEPEIDMEPVAVMMSLTPDGRVVWAGETMRTEDLQVRLRQERPKVRTVIVFADARADSETRSQLERLLSDSGFSEVVFRDRI